jgi:hypothetical protein
MSDNTETAILAGAVSGPRRELLRHRDGVISTRVGYTGGENDNPTTDNHPGHAEAVEVTFDPARTSYRPSSSSSSRSTGRTSAKSWSVPTTVPRSSIRATSSAGRRDTIADADASGLWHGKVVTKISEAAASGKLGPRTRTTSSTTPTGRISS